MNEELKRVFVAQESKILRFLQGRLQDEEVAQEVAREIWIKLENHNFGIVEEPRSYLFRIANNAATERRLSELSGSERGMLLRRHATIKARLAKLPKRTASIFEAFRFRGASLNAIAAAEGITVREAEQHLIFAYRQLLGGQSPHLVGRIDDEEI